MNEIHHVIAVVPFGEHRRRLSFDDGVAGEVDLADHLLGPIFEVLRDPAMFQLAHISEELGTVAWPNGAELDPCDLYEAVVSARTAPS